MKHDTISFVVEPPPADAEISAQGTISVDFSIEEIPGVSGDALGRLLASIITSVTLLLKLIELKG